MNKPDWQKQFPEVPENIHRSIAATLEGLEERDGNNMKQGKVKRNNVKIIVILAAAMAAVMGTTALAAEIFQWNSRASEVFVADEQEQNKLVAQGNVTGISQKVTDQGVSIELIQTIQDKNCFYALFEVSSQDTSLTLDENNQLAMDISYGGQENPFASLTWGFVPDSAQAPGSSRYFEINGTKLADAGTDSLKMDIAFSALQRDQGKAEKAGDMISGSWAFTMDVKQTSPETFTPDMVYSLGGCEVKVSSVEISPLSVTITCDAEGIRALEQKEGANISQTDLPASLLITGLRYQDKSTVSQQYGVMSFGYSADGKSFTLTQRFSTVVDVEKTEALLMGDNQDEIKLR